VGNAVKFTPIGGQVTIHLISQIRDIEIAVSNSGSFIAEVDLPHVFDRFWQARSKRLDH
jgi:signal transduction histidine kinase